MVYLLERQQPAQILVVDRQRVVGADVRREDGAVGTSDAVAGVCSPMLELVLHAVTLDDTVAFHASGSREHGDYIGAGAVFLWRRWWYDVSILNVVISHQL